MNPVLRLELKPDELLSLSLSRACAVHALSGEHWLSVAGRDYCLEGGQRAVLPRGHLLIEGSGRLALQVAAPRRRSWPQGQTWLLSW